MTAAARPMSDAERSQLRRSREARGISVYRVEVGAEVLDGLIIAGLQEHLLLDREAVQVALAGALIEWAQEKFSSRVTQIARGRA